MAGKRTYVASAVVVVLLAAWALPLAAASGDARDDKPAKADGKPDPKAAAKAGSKPATRPAPDKDNTVIVTAVTGQAQRKLMSDPKAKWQTVKVGDVLSDLTVVRTGLGSSVVIRTGDRGEMTIKSATKVGIREFSKKGTLATMRLGLKYGSMRARVDVTRGANDFRVSTPVATLSVRGSGGGWGFWGDRLLGFHGSSGNWVADFGGDQTRGAGAREWIGESDQRTGDIEGQRDDPGLGDAYGGLSEEELEGSRDSDGRGGGFNAGGASTTGGTLPDVSPPGHGSDTPPPVHPPEPPPPIR